MAEDKQLTSNLGELSKKFETKVEELSRNYNDTQLKELLVEHGLENVPLTSHTKKVLIKKLAQKIVGFDGETISCETRDAKDSKNQKNSVTTSAESNNNTSTTEMRRNLQEAKETLSLCLEESNKTHYAVCIPGSVNTITVHSDFREVLKIMKENKLLNPRMLSFRNLAEAENFAEQNSANEVCDGATIKSNYPLERAEVESGEVKLFPSLAQSQINEFRIQLEKGNINFCREKILGNPRFLIGNGDMPTILKEGTRYNAMHSSVIAGQIESCQLVMEMVSDIEFLKRMYGTQQRAEENSKRLVDLYLNTPDKSANKTPLHFASEKGMVDIVAFLVSFKACIRNFNKHMVFNIRKGDKHYESRTCTGKTPEELACSRYNGPNPATVKAKVINLIQEGTCYVPLIRSDTTGPYAMVGNPYTPSSPYNLVTEIEDSFNPASDVVLKDFRNMKVWAYAGPMSPQEAQDFKLEWKCPRVKRPDKYNRENLKVADSERGFERFGRELADAHSTSWQEYWPFLDAFADLRSEDGLDKLEIFFQKQRILILMQCYLLQQAHFVPAPPYKVGPDYVLRQSSLSKFEDSGGDNETFFSADSLSDDDDDNLNNTSGDRGHVSGKKPTKSSKECDLHAKTPTGLLSSLWTGLTKIKSYLSPSTSRSNMNHNVSNRTQVAEDMSESDSGSGSKNLKSEETQIKEQDNLTEGSLVEDNLSLPDPQPQDPLKFHSSDSQLTDSLKFHSTESHPTESLIFHSTDSHPTESLKFHSTDSHPTESLKFQSSDSLSDSLKLHSSDSQLSESLKLDLLHFSTSNSLYTPEPSKSCSKILDPDDSLSSELSFSLRHLEHQPLKYSPDSPSHLDISLSPRHWKYRTSKPNFDSPEKSPRKDLRLSPDLDYSRKSKDSAGKILHPEISASTPNKPSSKLNDSFNLKMDSICSKLENFSIVTPEKSLSFRTTSSLTENDNFETALEPRLHIFTGKMFAKFTSEINSWRIRSKSDECSTNLKTLYPILCLRQDIDQETVIADVFLPLSEGGAGRYKHALHGRVLEEQAHKELVKHVWVNFLAFFPTSNDARKICGLPKDEVMTAVIEGLPGDKDAFLIDRNVRSDTTNLKKLFMECQNELEETERSICVDVRVIRTATIPCHDIYVCGCVPTKVDADVYNTLNQQTCDYVHRQDHRFPLIHQWLTQMEKPGKDHINSLPSPSRLRRLERQTPLLPLISPLATTEKTRVPEKEMATPKTSRGSHPKENIPIKNLFS